MSEKEFDRYDREFRIWWRRFLKESTESCFERDILRDCKEMLKERYIARARPSADTSKGKTLLVG